MQKEDKAVKNEVEYSFMYVFLFSDWLGMKVRPEESLNATTSFLDSLKQRKMFYICLCTTAYAFVGEILYMLLGPDRAFTVEFLVPKIHIIGYTIMVYTTSTFAAAVSFMIIPVATRLYKHFSGKVYVKTFSFDVWYPVNMLAPVYYELCLILSNFISINTITVALNANVLFTGLSNHLCMFFRVLQEEIRGLRGSEEAGDYETFDDHKFWVKVIKRHQALITYIDLLESLFSPIFLAQFLLSSVDVCCSGFTGMVIDVSTLPANLTFIVSHIGEIGLLCWYGDNVYRESMKVSDAIYESDWCRCSQRSRKLMLFMMIRAQKPLRFTALRFRNINLETFTGILVTSYSYFTLLLNVYS